MEITINIILAAIGLIAFGVYCFFNPFVFWFLRFRETDIYEHPIYSTMRKLLARCYGVLFIIFGVILLFDYFRR